MTDALETITLPRTDLKATRIALGTWAIGGFMWGGTDDAESVRTIHRAIDRGINLIDTAPVYGFGRSEEVVGRALAEIGRDKALIATKAGLDWHDSSPFRNASKERIRHEVEDSLRRLRTDVIDIYQLHWPDPQTAIEETARVLAELHQAGKIRAIGVSNCSVEEMRAFGAVAPLHVAQPPYNLFERDAEKHVLPYCRDNGIATLAYGALCRGLLSGRMKADTSFTGDDLRRSDPKFQPPRFRQYLEATRRLDAFARETYGKSVLSLAVRWVLDKQPLSTALWGARHPGQLDGVADVMGWKLDATALTEIDRIVADCISDPVGPEFMAPPTRPASEFV
ncbi:MAG: aldo/keto reductase [Bradyrhizobiaceae bacterium]|nr:aldo/keto reductase [Bradyrhizobiaceae bacterium]